MPQKFQKKGGKSKIPTSPRAAELRGENEGKTGKIGIKVVLCEVLAAGERERARWKIGIFPRIWESPRDLGISGMRQIPKEREGISRGVSVCE